MTTSHFPEFRQNSPHFTIKYAQFVWLWHPIKSLSHPKLHFFSSNSSGFADPPESCTVWSDTGGWNSLNPWGGSIAAIRDMLNVPVLLVNNPLLSLRPTRVEDGANLWTEEKLDYGNMVQILLCLILVIGLHPSKSWTKRWHVAMH